MGTWPPSVSIWRVAQWQIVLPWGNMQAHKSMIDMAVKARAESNG